MKTTGRDLIIIEGLTLVAVALSALLYTLVTYLLTTSL